MIRTEGTSVSVVKPKIALVRAPILHSINAINNEATPAIGFAYIQAYLESKGYVASLIDGIGEGLNNTFLIDEIPGFCGHGLPLDELVARIPEDVGVIGFSGMFSGEWPLLRTLINKVRARFPQAFLVAGGEHVTGLTEYTLRDCPALDACVRGEGEHTFYELLEALGEGRPLTEVRGVAFVDSEGVYQYCGDAPRIREVSDLPWPKWDGDYLRKFWDSGKSYGVASARDMPIMVSRGCPYECTFCSNPRMWTRRYVLRDVDDVLAEVKSYVEKYDITALQFYDLTAITKRGWTIEFCQKLIAEGIKLGWSLPSGTRSEALDEETLGLLKDSGCVYMAYAPESGSPRTLELIKKKIDLGRLTRSVITAKKLGFALRTNLIIGFPHETRRDVLKTALFGFRMAVAGVDEVSLNIFSPYPGTEIFDELVRTGQLQVNDAYFLKLTSLNSDYTRFDPYTFNETMGPRELAAIRLFCMLANYAIGYLIYPRRIIRTLKAVFGKQAEAATVLEHRLRDLVNRKRAH